MTVWYMNGAGNNFAVVDARNMRLNMSEAAKILCENGDCDGFMALDNSKLTDIIYTFITVTAHELKCAETAQDVFVDLHMIIKL